MYDCVLRQYAEAVQGRPSFLSDGCLSTLEIMQSFVNVVESPLPQWQLSCAAGLGTCKEKLATDDMQEVRRLCKCRGFSWGCFIEY
jgi:hypothetical protein